MFSRISRSRIGYLRAAAAAVVAGGGGGGGAVNGSFSMAGEGNFTVSGTIGVNGSFSMAGEGDFTASGAIGVNGTFSMGGEGDFSATGSVGVSGAFSMAGEGDFTATGTVDFDPTTLSLTGYWRADYSGSSFSQTASAGTSGSNANLTNISNPPSSGTTVNGYTPADFDGTNDSLQAGSDTLDTYVNGTAASGWALVYLDADSSDILIDSNSKFVVSVDNTTPLAFIALNGTTSAARAVSLGAWALITFRYNGTNLQVGVNEAPGASGGGSSVSYSTAISPLTGNFYMGNGLAYGFLDGKVLEAAISDTALTDGNFASIKNYVNNRYGLSL